MENEKEFLSVNDLAKKLQVHPNTIRRGIKCGRIQACRIGNGKKASFRIHHTEIERITKFDLREKIEEIIKEIQCTDIQAK